MSSVNPPDKFARFSKITWNAQALLVPQLMGMIMMMKMIMMMMMMIMMMMMMMIVMMKMMVMMLIPALWSPHRL